MAWWRQAALIRSDYAVHGLRVLMGSPERGRVLQTASAPGELSRRSAWYCVTRFGLAERAYFSAPGFRRDALSG